MYIYIYIYLFFVFLFFLFFFFFGGGGPNGLFRMIRSFVHVLDVMARHGHETSSLGNGVRDSRLRVWGLGFRVQGLGFGDWGLGFRV